MKWGIEGRVLYVKEKTERSDENIMKRRINKKRTAWVLISFFIVFVFSPVNYAAAEPIDDLVAQMQEIYGFMDQYDKDNIDAARTALQNFVINDYEEDWDDVLGVNDPENNLLTEQVIAKFGDEATARAAAKDILSGLGEIYYSTDAAELRTTLETYKAEYIDEFQLLFGDDITMDEFYSLFLGARTALPGVIDTTEAGQLANDPNEDLIAAMPIYLDRAMNEALLNNPTFSGRLTDIGWSTDKLIAQQEVLAAEYIDQDGDARLSLALAFIRSETALASGATTLQVGDKPEYTINIMGRNATSLLAWESAAPNIVEVSTDEHDNFVIEAIAPGDAQLIVYRDYEGATPEYDWLLKFDVTVSKKPGSGSPGGGGGGGALPGYPIRVQGSTVQESGMVVEIPKDAVKYDTRGDIDRLDKNTINAPANSFIPGYIYDFTKIAEGDFLKPITVTLPYKQSAVDFEKYDLSIYWYDEDADEWVELDDVTVDKDDLTVSGETKKTGYFALIATKKAVPPVEPPVEPELPVLTDISGHWAKANIEYLVQMGAISGYPDNTFKPDNPITRAEFAVVLVKAFDLKAATGKVFDDTASHWAKDYIATAAANGIVTGYSETEFGPDDLITREQMAVMIVKAAKMSLLTGELNFSDAEDISDWATSYVVTAVQNELMKGYLDNSFKPLGNATRAEAATVIYNVLMK